jgi:hypothetical protein
MACVLAESELLYGAHGIAFFTLACSVVEGKKRMVPPKNWQSAAPSALGLKAQRKNAVCIRTGYAEGAAFPLVVVDADGEDAIGVVEGLLAETLPVSTKVPQVQTQRGATGRHFYFRSAPQSAAANLKSGAKLVIAGVQTNVDVRAGSNGEGIGCILAPPTAVVGGGKYVLLPGPAIHEAPLMPDALAEILGARPRVPKPLPCLATTAGHDDTGTGHARLMAAALRDATARAGTANVGTPVRVVCDGQTARVEFTHRVTRVCPVSRQEHKSNHFSVVLRLDERTGLPALFVFCHSEKEGCKGHGHRMLGFLDAEEGTDLCAEAGLDASAHGAVVPPTVGQAAVAIGEAQKSLDRLLENPNGPWATVENLSVVACALCTAAGGYAAFCSGARLMLAAVLDGTQLTKTERSLVERAFQRANVPMDPLATLRGFAAGLNGKREQELMVIREAIVANTDPALEADVPKAAEAMLRALETLEYRRSDGKVGSYCDVEQGGLFVFYVWHRVTRLSFDKWQTATDKKHELYLFNGATFKTGQKDTFVQLAYTHLKRAAEALKEIAPLQSRAEKLVERIAEAGDYFSRLTRHALATMQNSVMLEQCGLMSPEEFHHKLDTGPYIGFTNGVYDTARDVFLPRGQVGHNVLVSMSTTYAYVDPDDPRVGRAFAEIGEYYATLFAADASDPNDELVRKARLMVGSYLYPSNYAKKLHVYLGHEGNNGKSAFAEFLRLTLGDYYVTGNLSALTPGPRETLDVEVIRNYKALVCSFPEAQSSDRVSGHSMGLKLDSAKLKVMTGNDTVCARGLYQMPRNIGIKHKPIMMSNTMPELDHNDEAASGRVRVSLFGSRFVKTSDTMAEDHVRRIYRRTPNLNAKLEEWAPFHMLLMLEWLRAFKACDMELPPGDEHTEGSYANRAVALQTPEGKLREWVEEHYAHVPQRDKDSGTKLEVLHTAYTTCSPPIHQKLLGKILFGKMLNAVYPNIGPHRDTTSGMLVYLLR